MIFFLFTKFCLDGMGFFQIFWYRAGRIPFFDGRILEAGFFFGSGGGGGAGEGGRELVQLQSFVGCPWILLVGSYLGHGGGQTC